MKITIETDELVIRGGVLYSHGEVAKEETCKWKREDNKSDCKLINPHDLETWGFYKKENIFKHCPTCGKKIEVVE